jgi:hypothetical protein
VLIYTVTAIGRRGQDTATVVIAVGVGTTNLALRKHATQSSTYIHAVFTDKPLEIAGEIK